MQPTDKDLAEFALLGLEYVFIGLPNLVAWGDEAIETRNDPPTWAFDLSMATKLEDALSVLRQVHWLRGEVTQLMPQRLLFVLMKRDWTSGKLHWRKALPPLWHLLPEPDRRRRRTLPFVDVGLIRDLCGWVESMDFMYDSPITENEIIALLEQVFVTSEPGSIALPNWV